MPTKHSQQERSNEKGVSTEPEASKDHGRQRSQTTRGKGDPRPRTRGPGNRNPV